MVEHLIAILLLPLYERGYAHVVLLWDLFVVVVLLWVFLLSVRLLKIIALSPFHHRNN